MPTEAALQRSAQAWCTNKTKHLVMIPELAEAFASILDEAYEKTQDEMYLRGNQLAAISTVLHANTPITLSQTRLPKDHALYTAAFQDAVTAIEREIGLRNQNLQQRGIINVLADRLARWTGTTVPDEIRKAREVCIEEQAYADLAASGGIVDAP